ncbi:MAG: hypothetical protein AB8F95_14595 [Bacteroidia bacterium]
MLKSISLFFGVIMCASSLFAQDEVVTKDKAIAFLYDQGWGTRAVGISFRKDNATMPLAFGIRAYGIRSGREQFVRPSEIYTQPGRRFVYGKLNRILAVAPFIETSKVLIAPGRGNLFDLNLFGQIGPLFGLERPYYVDVFEVTTGGGPGQPARGIAVPTPFSEEIGYSDILGRSRTLEYGWDQLSIRPGVSLRVGARVGLARRSAYLTELVMSVQTDYFPQALNILTTENARRFHPGVSLGLVVGSRW